ncbi:DUF2846 domain-containing protein [Fibrella sp. HMF5335]|uniref:DUF2846 domain-containing protein n=1 Tax=Fibrella rubiginis TaxID=2817060 RepID=A0A939GLC2_9BACT|nr:DUF2846 domain-containing protein [Fibrella rubiginis]MBO0938508.1 DUF2846 domain-containing protein [Fibrella rubiginis]
MRSLTYLIGCLFASSSLCLAQIPDPTPDMATVVFYRPAQFSRSGVNFTIRANGAELCRLSNKRYFVSKLKPGQTEFTSVAGGLNIPDKDGLSMKLEANKVYYFQGDVKVRFMSDKLVLTEVTESTAQKKLPDMKPDNCMTASN